MHSYAPGIEFRSINFLTCLWTTLVKTLELYEIVEFIFSMHTLVMKPYYLFKPKLL